MNQPNGKLNPGFIYDLYHGGEKPQIVRIALLLDVFTPLAEGPKDVAAMALRCGCEEAGLRFLLDYLSSVGVIEKMEEIYTLNDTTAAFLVPASPTYAGDWFLLQSGPEFWGDIFTTLRGGQRNFPPVPWPQDAWLESYLQERIPRSLEMWAAAGFEAGKCQGLHILDLACGCATKSFTLAAADPGVRVTCVDSSEVLAVARDLAGRKGLLDRVVFRPGDIHSLDLEAAAYGAALLGQFSYFLTLEQNLALFRRIHRALLPGGVLVIDALMAADTPSEQSSMTSLLMWAWSGGATHSFEEYVTLLKKAGFSKVEKQSDWWLSARK